MSTSINKGNQKITFGFQTAATSENFNAVCHTLIRPGVYDWWNRVNGGELLSRLDDNTVRISPFTAFIAANNKDVSVRVETTSFYDIDVTSTAPFIVLSFSWSNVVANYVDILTADITNIEANSEYIVLGRGVFDSSSNLTSTFDYSRTDYSNDIREEQELSRSFYVVPTSPISSSVGVSAGKMRTVDGVVEVASVQTSPAISSTSAGRYDLVWINRAGTIQVTEGTEGVLSAPAYGDKMVVAEIRRESSTDVVTGDDIVQVYNYRMNFNEGAKTIGIEDATGNYTTNNVEDTLAEIETRRAQLQTEIEERQIGLDRTALEFVVAANETRVSAGSLIEADGTFYTVAGSGETPSGVAQRGAYLFFDPADSSFLWSSTPGEYDPMRGGVYDSSGRRQCRWQLTSTSTWIMLNPDTGGRYAEFVPKRWSQLGNSLTVLGSDPALAALSETRVAYVDGGSAELRIYQFDGVDWVLTETTPLGSITNPALTALNGTDVAYIDGTNEELRTYRSDGTNWSQVGNSLTVSGVSTSKLAALNGTDIAFTDNSIDELRTYRFDGTNWSQVGNSLSLIDMANGSLAALSETDVAFMSTTGFNTYLETYRFDGTNWSQIGNTLHINGFGSIAALNNTDVVCASGVDDEIKTYRFDGADWGLIGSRLSVTFAHEAVAALNGTDIAFVDSSNDELRTYWLETQVVLPSMRPHALSWV